jgi:hypothetical protein
MKMEFLTKAHYEHMFSKYEKLYTKKFKWGGKELTDSLVKCHINNVVKEMDEDEYLKEIGLVVWNGENL